MNKRKCYGSYDEIIGATPAYKLSSFSTESDDKVIVDADTDEILGAAIIGAEASEVVTAIQIRQTFSVKFIVV